MKRLKSVTDDWIETAISISLQLKFKLNVT